MKKHRWKTTTEFLNAQNMAGKVQKSSSSPFYLLLLSVGGTVAMTVMETHPQGHLSNENVLQR